jgi:hypothetical protein
MSQGLLPMPTQNAKRQGHPAPWKLRRQSWAWGRSAWTRLPAGGACVAAAWTQRHAWRPASPWIPSRARAGPRRPPVGYPHSLAMRSLLQGSPQSWQGRAQWLSQGRAEGRAGRGRGRCTCARRPRATAPRCPALPPWPAGWTAGAGTCVPARPRGRGAKWEGVLHTEQMTLQGPSAAERVCQVRECESVAVRFTAGRRGQVCGLRGRCGRLQGCAMRDKSR